MRRSGFALFSLLVGSGLIAIAQNGAHAQPRAVVELFTSQGCSSCPPADKLAAELAKDPSLIVMSLAIDYWDYLGWKDTLALHGHSNRQHAYARVRGDREVYTPQVVVNGSIQVLGSDKSAIEDAMKRSRADASTLSIPVTMAVADDRVTVTLLQNAAQHGTAEVWLCPMTSAKSVAIAKGENNGHTLTYTNVVRRWLKLGDWKGDAASFSIPLSQIKTTPDVDAVSVIVQNGVASAPGNMVGAAMIALH